MAAPQQDQQAFPPPTPYQQYTEGEYQPAPAQFPSQPDAGYPGQGQPPSYVYGGQPGYQPMPAPPPVSATSATVVVATQPTPVTTTCHSPPEEDHSVIAICALVFSIITLICCGASLILLTCSIPALVLAIVALGTRGSSQKTNAGISIGLNVAVVVVFVLLLVITIVVPLVVGAALVGATTYTPYTSCTTYYSYSYSTYCVAYKSAYGVCSYSASLGSYCPY